MNQYLRDPRVFGPPGAPSPGSAAMPHSPAPLYPGWGQDEKNLGPTYGQQQRETWNFVNGVGETDRRPVLDSRRATSLWRVTILGDVNVFLRYGTAGQNRLELAAPVEGAFPGFVEAEAEPRVAPTAGNPVEAVVTLTPATASGRPSLRSLVDAGGGAVTLPNAAAFYTALTASTLTVRTIAGIAVPVLSTVPVLSGSVVTAGSGIVEFEA